MSSQFGNIVNGLTHNHDAWVVGSAADPENKNPRDIDIMVPYSSWGPASSLIPKDAKVNSFGGWKFTEQGVEVDVWPGELSWILQRPRTKFVWHPKTGIRFQRYESSEQNSLPTPSQDLSSGDVTKGG
jgi:hypothetical protein